MSAYNWIENALLSIHKANWYRSEKTITSKAGSVIIINGKELINFGSNDYLGLASDPRLIHAAIEATKKYGTGSTGSRLVTGHRDIHEQLEQSIASLKRTESALVFSSGYLANIGTITAITNQKDLILCDQYNHSSLKNGAKLSNAKIIEYNHCNLQDLEKKLQKNRSQYRRCLILTDTVFSMDGDICPLPEIINLAERYNCMLLIDEAHSTGVMGKKGTGCVEHFNCTGKEIIQMGTLSKALGSLGGYIAGSQKLIEFLKNRASTWIYTTGLSPADTASALEAIHIIKTEPQRRENLWQNVNYLKSKITPLNLNLLLSESPILCLGLANPQQALNLSQLLQEKGIFAPAIRPPTVPTSRVRITVMATHTLEQLNQLIDGISFYLNS